MQRPIAVLRDLDLPTVDPARVRSIRVRTPQATVHPLVHPQPVSGLQAKFSLPYAIAAVLLDRAPGFDSFTDEAVRRPAATELMSKVILDATPGGDWLLDGMLEVTLDLAGQDLVTGSLKMPPGSPARPPSVADLRSKVDRCCPDLAADVMGLSWSSARQLLDAKVTRAAVSPAR
jgi:2-methylcitrate dehydratase PrpD